MSKEYESGREGASQRLLSQSSDSSANYHSIQSTSRTHSYMNNNEAYDDKAPKDKWNYIYIMFYVLGLGTLLPWNFFITANGYWMYKLQDNATKPTVVVPTVKAASSYVSNVTETDHSLNQLQSLFQNSLSICAMLPNVLFQFLNTALQQRVAEKVRILGSLLFMIAIFIMTEVLVKVDVSGWQDSFFALTMVSVVILNSCSAIFQSSLFGMVSRLPVRYMQAVMAGQGMGGVFAAVAMIVTLSMGSGPTDSALSYFLVAIIVLFLTGVCYLLLRKNDFYNYYSNGLVIKKKMCAGDIGSECEKPRDNRDSGVDVVKVYEDVYTREDAMDENVKKTKLLDDLTFKKTTAPVPPLFAIFKEIWIHCFCVMFVFVVTLACYPSITASVKSLSTSGEWKSTYFTPVACFLLFNVCDWLGRTIVGYLHFPSEKNAAALLICVLARVVFPVLFALCNAQPRSSAVVFSHDAYYIVFMILFGLSNGYLGTLAVQYGPKRVSSPERAATAGSMLACSISIGLAAGAGFSFVIKTAI